MNHVERIRTFDSTRLRQSAIISSAEFARFRYYELKHGQETEYHDVIGVREERHAPLLLQVRLMHINQAAFDSWSETGPQLDMHSEQAPESLDGLSAVESSLYCTRSELQAVIKFFDRWAGAETATEEDSTNHFQLLECPADSQSWTLTCDLDKLFLFEPSYRYCPSANIPHHSDMVATVSLPHWAQHVSQDQAGSIHFFVFRRSDLENPAFDPYVTYGLGVITFDRPALRDFVAILMSAVQ